MSTEWTWIFCLFGGVGEIYILLEDREGAGLYEIGGQEGAQGLVVLRGCQFAGGMHG